jgi:hypothetical protein
MEDNINMNLKQKGCEDVDWIHMTLNGAHSLAPSCEHGSELVDYNGGKIQDNLNNY